MNLHQFRLAWILCLSPVVLAGCSTTMGSRLGGSSQAKSQPEAKSITVSGDRNVSVATGDPGSQVVVAADPEPKLNPKGRISGKVLDDQGDPVPNVTVRLADGGTKGGKDVRATTDKTGRFHPQRPSPWLKLYADRRG